MSNIHSDIILCIPNSFSSSKSKLIFSKYILNFPFHHSSDYAVCAVRLIVQWLLHFVAFGFFFKAITLTSVNSLDHCPVSHTLLISCVIILRPSVTTLWVYLPGTSSFPVAFFFIISLIPFSTSLCKVIMAFLARIYFLFRFTSRSFGCLGQL